VIERHNGSIKITEVEELHRIAKGAKGFDFGMEPRPRRQFVDGHRPGRG